MTVAEQQTADHVGPPQWVEASLAIKVGRDPLGLQTTTQDRLTPILLPGVLELSRRARYFSFHAYLLDKYRELRNPPDGKVLSRFIKEREWEFGLAVLHCPHGCDSTPVGKNALDLVVNHQAPPFPRGESVESAFGGYGLYYRSPLAEFGIIARSGTMLGETPIVIDVLRETERARTLADSFRDAISGTEYEQQWMLTTAPIPLDVLVEYARACCLCQLPHREAERQAISAAIFGTDEESQPAMELPEADTPAESSDGLVILRASDAARQRLLSVGHYLSLVDAMPAVVDEQAAFRSAMWLPAEIRSEDHDIIAGQWAGLIAKDVWQEALCSVWSEFCRTGLSATRERDGRGLTWSETRELVHGLVDGPPELDSDTKTAELAEDIAQGGVDFPEPDDGPVCDASLEALRAATARLDTATSGLVALLELSRRSSARSGQGWELTSHSGSAWQVSIASVFETVARHLEEDPTVGDTLWWLVKQYIVRVHERIAYSKLPEDTFRFRWEEGRLQFYDNGVGRFPLAAIRNRTLSDLTFDLALWERVGLSARLTPRGQAFLTEVLS
jgi:hypothetical protein